MSAPPGFARLPPGAAEALSPAHVKAGERERREAHVRARDPGPPACKGEDDPRPERLATISPASTLRRTENGEGGDTLRPLRLHHDKPNTCHSWRNTHQ